MDEIARIDTGEDAVVYTKDNCVKCDDTKSLMDKLGVKYRTINIDSHPEARIAVKKAGYRQAPVVITRDSKWSGFDETKIRGLVNHDDIWG